jgi:hypothetical protein
MPKRFALLFLGLLTIIVFFSTIFLYRTNTQNIAANVDPELIRKAHLLQQEEEKHSSDVVPSVDENTQKQNATKYSIKREQTESEPPLHTHSVGSHSSFSEKFVVSKQELYDEPLVSTQKQPISSGGGYITHSDSIQHTESTTIKNDVKGSGSDVKPSQKSREANSKIIVRCRNTVSGRMWITDSRGFICQVDHLDPITQCCKTELSEQYSCVSCNSYGCCEVYERCVSCCMDRKRVSSLNVICLQNRELTLLNCIMQRSMNFCTGTSILCFNFVQLGAELLPKVLLMKTSIELLLNTVIQSLIHQIIIAISEISKVELFVQVDLFRLLGNFFQQCLSHELLCR